MSLMNYGFTKSPVDSNTSESKKVLDSKKFKEIVSKSPEKSDSQSPKKKNKLEPKSVARKSTSKPSHKSPHYKIYNMKIPISAESQSPKAHSSELLPFSPVIPKNVSDLSLPPQRVKMIMKSCPEVEMVPQESLHLITKATELFIQHLATESLRASPDTKLDYECLSNHIHSCKNLEFLKETIPKKLTLEECKRIIALRNRNREDAI